jgi:hypothetical protein
MAYILKPSTGDDLWVNAWNWYPTIELLVRAGVFAAQRAERLHYNCGGDVTEAEASKIAVFLTSYLSSRAPGERLLIDGTLTSEPDTFEMFRGPDWDKNYSATFEWLQKFKSFCEVCGGFTVL